MEEHKKNDRSPLKPSALQGKETSTLRVLQWPGCVVLVMDDEWKSFSMDHDMERNQYNWSDSFLELYVLEIAKDLNSSIIMPNSAIWLS